MHRLLGFLGPELHRFSLVMFFLLLSCLGVERGNAGDWANLGEFKIVGGESGGHESSEAKLHAQNV